MVPTTRSMHLWYTENDARATKSLGRQIAMRIKLSMLVSHRIALRVTRPLAYVSRRRRVVSRRALCGIPYAFTLLLVSSNNA